jgi:Skp family chaperone for outer membrane proteins
MLRLAAVLVFLLALPVLAQEQTDLPLGQLRSPVLIIDTERVFTGSLFGQRIAAQVQADSEALVTENRRIEAALTEEERSLTIRRPTMDVDAFQVEADAFDERVQGIRRAQDAKQRALQDGIVTGRDQFLQAATPILGQIMQESAAAVILDRRSVFLGIGTIDITDQAIARIDAAIGDGADLPVPDPVPEPTPPPNDQN